LIRVSLSDGKVPPIFRPVRRKSGNPGVGANEAYIIALAARAMSELMSDGLSKKEAAQKVANALRANQGKYRRASAKTVQGWRDRIREGGGGGRIPPRAIEYYNEIIPQGIEAVRLLDALSGAARLGLVDSEVPLPE
jgi:uncharacterized protein YoaH (UPF0181 family)